MTAFCNKYLGEPLIAHMNNFCKNFFFQIRLYSLFPVGLLHFVVQPLIPWLTVQTVLPGKYNKNKKLLLKLFYNVNKI